MGHSTVINRNSLIIKHELKYNNAFPSNNKDNMKFEQQMKFFCNAPTINHNQRAKQFSEDQKGQKSVFNQTIHNESFFKLENPGPIKPNHPNLISKS